MLRAAIAAGLLGLVPALHAAAWDEARIHDPSTIIRCGAEYWFFATGPGIVSRRSTNLTDWQRGPRVFTNPPAWTRALIPENRGFFWAPDIIQVSNRFLLYYSVSRWGKNTSAIGLASTPTLDPDAPGFRWRDDGIVIETTTTNDFNAIDPAIHRAPDGRLWMALGSFWSGIKLIELDAATGRRHAINRRVHALAQHPEIEAAALTTRGGWNYLFVNWGLCCRGTNSTYEIRAGRSREITGPYLDREGRDLAARGGTVFLQSSNRFHGPGHAAVFADGTNTWVSHHFYDRQRGGTSALAVRRLSWDTEGWPVAGEIIHPR
jgi:arabinan endo-1,5-alpha-L-arabinosidase